MKSVPNLPQTAMLALMLIAASGCGLSDYQSRLDANRERVQAFDEANRLLDDPIEVPIIQFPATKDSEAREGRAWPFDVYLRLPNGFTRAKDKDPYNNFLFRYAGGNQGAYAIFIAAAGVTDPKAEEAPPAGSYTVEEFRGFIKPSLEAYCLKALNIPPSLQEKTTPTTTYFKPLDPYANAPGALKVTCAFYTLTDESNVNIQHKNAFDIYVHEKGGRQICIAVHRPVSASNATLKSAIETCLGSLDISGNASTRRADYKKAKANN